MDRRRAEASRRSDRPSRGGARDGRGGGAAKRGLRRAKEVALVGLGTFAAAVRPARRGFNPPTKPPPAIRAITTVRFKPGAELRAMA